LEKYIKNLSVFGIYTTGWALIVLQKYRDCKKVSLPKGVFLKI
jgi:hypothetical protein